MTERLFAAEQNAHACEIRLQRAYAALKAAEAAHQVAVAELEEAAAEAELTSQVPDFVPEGLAAGGGAAAAHAPTVITQDYTS